MGAPETVMIVLHGQRPIHCPLAGRFAPFVFRPGVRVVGREHWELLCAANSADSAEFHAARASGLIGPVDDTPPPRLVTRQVLVPGNSEEAKVLDRSGPVKRA